MQKHLNTLILSISLVLILLGSRVLAEANTAEAESLTTPDTVYYLADGDNGVDQVFRQVLDGQNNRQQLTNSESDIVAFGVAVDGLSVAYIANGRLQLQRVDAENNPAPEAEELVVIDGGQTQSSPVFSPDGQYLAYADHGVWLMDLNTGAAHLLLADIPFDASAPNTSDFRLYTPDRFVIDPQTDALKLLIHIVIWEYSAVGVYDIAAGNFQEIELYNHTQLLPLSDGRVLIYGNSFIGGEAELEIAASLGDVANPELMLDLNTVPGAAETYIALSAYQAVEIQAGKLRVFVYPLDVKIPLEDGIHKFYFDFDLESGTVSEVQVVRLGEMEYSSDITAGPVSPDGMKVAVYGSYAVSETGTEAGTMQIYNLMTGEPTSDLFPDRVGEFQWHGMTGFTTIARR